MQGKIEGLMTAEEGPQGETLGAEPSALKPAIVKAAPDVFFTGPHAERVRTEPCDAGVI